MIKNKIKIINKNLDKLESMAQNNIEILTNNFKIYSNYRF